MIVTVTSLQKKKEKEKRKAHGIDSTTAGMNDIAHSGVGCSTGDAMTRTRRTIVQQVCQEACHMEHLPICLNKHFVRVTVYPPPRPTDSKLSHVHTARKTNLCLRCGRHRQIHPALPGPRFFQIAAVNTRLQDGKKRWEKKKMENSRGRIAHRASQVNSGGVGIGGRRGEGTGTGTGMGMGRSDR